MQIQSLDRLTTSVPTWNNRAGDHSPIALRDGARCVPASYEYIPEKLIFADGRESGFSQLRCSDNGAVIGVPYNPKTYSLLNNDKFLSVIENIGAQLDKLGVKWSVATTGTLNERGRIFVGLKLENNAEFSVDGRTILSFLNCLNSVDKSARWTFANNTFTVCCKNTFAMSLQGEKGSEFHACGKHSTGMQTALFDVPRMVEAFITGNEALLGKLKAFSVFPVGLQDAEEIFTAWMGQNADGSAMDGAKLSTRGMNIIDRLSYLFVRGQGNKGQTAFDLFNAVTEYYTHESAGKSDDANKQLNSSEMGDGAKAKADFFATLIKLTEGTGNNFRAFAKVGNTILVQYRNKPAK